MSFKRQAFGGLGVKLSSVPVLGLKYTADG